MGENEDGCLRCGEEYDARIEIAHTEGEQTAGVKTSETKQICVYSNTNGTWLYIHREGGGSSD